MHWHVSFAKHNNKNSCLTEKPRPLTSKVLKAVNPPFWRLFKRKTTKRIHKRGSLAASHICSFLISLFRTTQLSFDLSSTISFSFSVNRSNLWWVSSTKKKKVKIPITTVAMPKTMYPLMVRNSEFVYIFSKFQMSNLPTPASETSDTV